MSRDIALITGVTGQDGAYLAELLLDKGYQVHGIARHASSPNTPRIDHLLKDARRAGNFILHYGDMTDGERLTRLIQEIKPTAVYNLAAQSHVGASFEMPEYTANVDALGALRLLEAIRILGMGQDVRFYQASTSELFGNAKEFPQRETTPFSPRSPYGVAKLYAYWITVNYREAYGFHASNGILFNHESPMRGEMFLTRKVTRRIAEIEAGQEQKVFVGNLDAKRDWGHARDYVEGMWLMLQQPVADDYVLATGEARSVREFIVEAFAVVGRSVKWQGSGIAEVGIDAKSGQTLIEVDPKYFRPAEVDSLVGDAAKARNRLGWRPRVSFKEMVSEMIHDDIMLLGVGKKTIGSRT